MFRDAPVGHQCRQYVAFKSGTCLGKVWSRRQMRWPPAPQAMDHPKRVKTSHGKALCQQATTNAAERITNKASKYGRLVEKKLYCDSR